MVQFVYRIIKQVPFCKHVYKEYLLSRFWAPVRGCSSYIYSPPYTPEEQNIILQKINHSTEEELTRYAISKARAKNLVKFKQRSGHFVSLNEILQVDSLGVKVLDKLCVSILKDDTKPESEAKENKKRSIKRLVTPFVHKSHLQEVDSIASIHIHANAVSLAQINLQADLLAWDLHQIDINKIHIAALFEFTQNFIKLLPTADIYVMEDVQRYSSVGQQQSVVARQNTVFTAILMSLLNVCRTDEQENKVLSNKHRVLFLHSMLPARHFQIIVGGERISAQTVVNKILQDSPTSVDHTPISIDLGLKHKYLTSDSIEKEHYSQALLLAITFLELIVYEKPIS